MIDFGWMKYMIMGEPMQRPIDLYWCEQCKLNHVLGDHVQNHFEEPVEPELLVEPEVKIAGLIEDSVG